jgi:peptidyl-prolyl cis-trans isomerase D
MLSFVRKHATSWIIKILLFIIVIVFVAWGGYSYQTLRATRLARVGNHYISHQEYNNAYNYMIETYRRQFGKAFSEDLLRQLNIKEQVLKTIIDRYVIIQAAGDMGLAATTDEVQQMILKHPAFQKDGKFDQNIYTLALRQARMTPQEFEAQMQESITIQNVQNFVNRRVVVTDDELRAYAQFNGALLQVVYTPFDAKSYEDQVTLDESAIDAYYQSHQERYRNPEKRQFAMAVFRPDSYTDGVTVSEEDVANYYADHKQEYYQAPQVKASHILLRVAENAPEEEVNKAREEAQKVLEEVKKEGANFAELARQYSQDPSAAQNGGDLGFFTRDKMVPAFAEAAFAMQPGQISDLVRTQFGFHIIKVEETKPEKTTTLDEARDRIVEAVKRDKAKEIAYEKAQAFADLAYAERDVKKVAQDQKLELTGVGAWTSQRDPLPNVGVAPDASKELFALPDKGVSNVIETPQGFIIAQVEAIQEPKVPPLEEVKDRVQKELRAEEARKVAQQKAAEFLDVAKQKNSLQDAAKERGMEVKTSDWFSREKPDKDLRLAGEALQKVFELQELNSLADKPLEMGGQYVALQLVGKKTPDAESIEKELPALRGRLVQEKQAEVWEAWIAEQRSKVEIEQLQEL